MILKGAYNAAKFKTVRKSKYRNVKTRGFASKREANRYDELKLLEKSGAIKNLRKQVEFELIPKQDGERAVKYFADFVYDDERGQSIVEDSKGRRTAEYVIKRKLMLFRHWIKILET